MYLNISPFSAFYPRQLCYLHHHLPPVGLAVLWTHGHAAHFLVNMKCFLLQLRTLSWEVADGRLGFCTWACVRKWVILTDGPWQKALEEHPGLAVLCRVLSLHHRGPERQNLLMFRCKKDKKMSRYSLKKCVLEVKGPGSWFIADLWWCWGTKPKLCHWAV